MNERDRLGDLRAYGRKTLKDVLKLAINATRCIQLTSGMAMLRRLINPPMNLRVPWKSKTSLFNWRTGGFWRRTLLQGVGTDLQ
jgi:hypothetical protein